MIYFRNQKIKLSDIWKEPVRDVAAWLPYDTWQQRYLSHFRMSRSRILNLLAPEMSCFWSSNWDIHHYRITVRFNAKLDCWCAGYFTFDCWSRVDPVDILQGFHGTVDDEQSKSLTAVLKIECDLCCGLN
jgi:hypothetical protein